MELQINKIMQEDVKAAIMDKINNLSKGDCIDTYCKLVSVRIDYSTNPSFEQKFLEVVKEKEYQFAERFLKEFVFEKQSKEELVKNLVDAHMESPYCYDARRDNGEHTYFFKDYVTDIEIHSFIKEHLIDCFNIADEKEKQTFKDKEIKRLEGYIDSYKGSISSSQSLIDKYSKELKELKGE